MKASRIIGFNAHNDNVSAHETHFQTIAYDDHGQAHHAKNLGCEPQEITKYKLETELAFDSVLIASALHSPTTTIHSAIITQAYRCYETAVHFKGKINAKDAEGMTSIRKSKIKHRRLTKTKGRTGFRNTYFTFKVYQRAALRNMVS